MTARSRARSVKLATLVVLSVGGLGAVGAQEPPADPDPVSAPPPEPAPAPPVAAESAADPQALQLHGFVSTAWTQGLTLDEGSELAFRVFDFDSGSIKVNVAEVVLLRPNPDPGQWGFRIDFTAGASIPRVAASAGLFRDSDGAGDFDLQQAYASYVAPVGNGVRIDAGKFITHLGAEVIEGYDGWNDNYSRSILFGYAIAFTHTGLRLSYSVNPKTSLMLMLVNGWDNVEDNNDMKTLGLQVGLFPTSQLSLYLNYAVGPEQADNDDNIRHIVDVVAVFKPTDALALTLNGDLGLEAEAAADGGDATWWGVALGVRYSVSSSLDIAVRGEVFDDKDGARTTVVQRLMEGTLTVAWKAGNFVIRPELRIDVSDEEVFNTGSTEDPGDASKTQATVAVNILAAF